MTTIDNSFNAIYGINLNKHFETETDDIILMQIVSCFNAHECNNDEWLPGSWIDADGNLRIEYSWLHSQSDQEFQYGLINKYYDTLVRMIPYLDKVRAIPHCSLPLFHMADNDFGIGDEYIIFGFDMLDMPLKFAKSEIPEEFLRDAVWNYWKES